MMPSLFVANQSGCFFLCSREKIQSCSLPNYTKPHSVHDFRIVCCWITTNNINWREYITYMYTNNNIIFFFKLCNSDQHEGLYYFHKFFQESKYATVSYLWFYFLWFCCCLELLQTLVNLALNAIDLEEAQNFPIAVSSLLSLVCGQCSVGSGIM